MANGSSLCWLVAVALGSVCYYLHTFAPYRDIRGYSKDRIEDYCLWLAGLVSAIGILAGAAGLIVLCRSGNREKGSYRLSIGLAINLLALLAVIFTLLVQGLLRSASA